MLDPTNAKASPVAADEAFRKALTKQPDSTQSSTGNPAVNVLADEDDLPAIRLSLQLALAGFKVHTLPEGGFIICRWGLSKHCPDVRTLGAFARQVGAKA